jgi:hypothetical protein
MNGTLSPLEPIAAADAAGVSRGPERQGPPEVPPAPRPDETAPGRPGVPLEEPLAPPPGPPEPEPPEPLPPPPQPPEPPPWGL